MPAFALDCEIWTGYIRPTDGYGWFKQRPAHRVAYEEAYGPVDRGRHVHHLCGVPSCVALDHLISVTPAQHVVMFGAKPRKKKWCSRGHEVAVFGRNDRGTCRECNRESARAQRRRKWAKG